MFVRAFATHFFVHSVSTDRFLLFHLIWFFCVCVFEGNLLFLCDVPFLLTELTSERRITSCYLAFSAAFERDEMGRKKQIQ